MRRVFVSSTFEDLKEHRKRVITQLRRANFHVVAMEGLTAECEPPMQISTELIKGCELCILIIARRRGHVPKGHTLSITQMEVETAKRLGMDILVYMLREGGPWFTQWDEEERDPKFVEWRNHLKEIHTPQYFGLNPRTLRVLPGVAKWLKKKEESGKKGGTSDPSPARGIFVGCEYSISGVVRLLEEEQTRGTQSPVALFGMGGVGKSALAREVMHRMRPRFPGGQLVIERPPGGRHKDVQAVFSGWAVEYLDLPPEQKYSPDQMRRYWARQSAPRICLFEGAAEGDIDNLIKINSALPGDWPRLVTTREQAVCAALEAVVFPVRGLTSEDSLALIEARLHASFDGSSAEGANGVKRAITEHRDALLKLVEKVGGLPLALRLAVGACDSLAEIPDVVRRLLSALNRGVRAFENEAMVAADRNDSLAASLSLSLEDLYLADSENSLGLANRFRALGVLPDGWSYDDQFLLAVWGDASKGGEGSSALKWLVRHSMIDKDPDTALYRIHPVLRAFACESLSNSPDLLQSTRRRYHRIVVERAMRSYRDSPRRWTAPDDLYGHLAQVLETLRATLEAHAGMSIEVLTAPIPKPLANQPNSMAPLAEDAETGMQLAEAFKRAVYQANWGLVGTQLLELGLVCSRLAGDRIREAEYQSLLGTRHGMTGAIDLAEQHFAEATRIARSIEAPNLGFILTSYAEFRRWRSDATAAMEMAQEAIAIQAARNDEHGAAQARSVLGETLWRLNRLDEAQQQYELARTVLKQVGDRQGLADLLNKLASVEFNRGSRYEQAAELFLEALAEHEALRDDVMKAEDLNDLGACYRYLGSYRQAEDYFKRALELNRRLDNSRLVAINLCNLAGAFYAQDQHELARQRAQEGRSLAEEVFAPSAQIWGWVWEGLAWRGMGEVVQSERCLLVAVSLGRRFNEPRSLAGALARLGLLVADDLHRPSEGLAMLMEAAQLLRSRGMSIAFSNISIMEIEAHTRRLGPSGVGS
jgi:tetratricopeptide (TPR) repeat protein